MAWRGFRAALTALLCAHVVAAPTPTPWREGRWWDSGLNGERVLAVTNFRVTFKEIEKRLPALHKQGYRAIQVITTPYAISTQLSFMTTMRTTGGLAWC